MSPSFNLISEPWIPCLRLDGRSAELGLRDVLSQAHELREIRDNSPLVTAALHRLLLAILHRNFGPAKHQEWMSLWRNGRFDADVLESYLDRWWDRFDLHGDEYPFYQIRSELNPGSQCTVVKLMNEFASGNNDTLFDHSSDSAPPALTPAQVARAVVAYQNYSLCGLSGIRGSNYIDTPLLRKALLMLKGRSLFETLMLNMVTINEGQPPPNDHLGIPVWERTDDSKPKKRVCDGYTDYLTWMSRCITLLWEPEGYCRHVMISPKDEIAVGVRDPMTSIFQRADGKGFIEFRFEYNKSCWRDLHVLLARDLKMVRRAETVEQLATRVKYFPAVNDVHVSMELIGAYVEPRKAVVKYWRHECFPLPLAYLDDPDLVVALKNALGWTEAIGRALDSSIWNLARSLYIPQADDKNKLSKAQNRDISKLARSFVSLRQYWAMLDLPFHDLFLTLPTDPEGTKERWCAVLRRTAWSALELATESLDGSARALKAATRARATLGAALNKKETLPHLEEVIAHAE